MSEEPLEERASANDGIVFGPRRGVLGGTFALAALVVLAGVLGSTGPWLVLALVGALGIVLLGSNLQSRFRVRHFGGFKLSREGVFVNGRHVIKRGSIVSAHLSEEEGEHWVHVTSRLGASFSFGVRDAADGRDAIDALHLDAGNATARFILVRGSKSKPRLLAPFFLPMAALLLVPFSHVGTMVAAAALSLVSMAWSMSAVRQVVVGADGLRIRDGISASRFIPHDAIETVTREYSDVEVRLRGGELVTFPMGFARRPGEAADERTESSAKALLERIEAARDVFAERAGETPNLGSLARGERTIPEWVDALRRAGEEAEGGFRDAVSGRARLWDLVMSGQTPPRTRIAAAVALRVAASPDDDTRTRIAAVAESCASPDLATRMRIAAEGEDDEIEALLEKVEPEKRRL